MTDETMNPADAPVVDPSPEPSLSPEAPVEPMTPPAAPEAPATDEPKPEM